MMAILDFLNQARSFEAMPAIIFKEQSYTYSWLCQQEDIYFVRLQKEGIQAGSIVALVTNYSPEALAIFMALMRLSVIIMPLTNDHHASKNGPFSIIQPNFIIELNPNNGFNISKSKFHEKTHHLISELRIRKTAGLIIFSSGSTGTPKAIVHDISLLINGLKASRNKLKVISFLLFDHIGGINTILNTLISGNCLVVPPSRTPNAVSQSIELNKVDVLITSPSFLNLMLISDVFKNKDLNCLKQINYGSEVMPFTILEKLAEKLPHTKLIQTYGLSELGVIKTQTNNHHSNLINIIDKNVKYRIKNEKLEIYSKNSMLGYLNAPSPFTDDGWFMTGDVVEIVDGSLRILGRDSELINIGGQKVFPAEIENILLQLPEVEDVSVLGEKNPILGNLIVANIKLKPEANHEHFKHHARAFCLSKMALFKVPQKFNIVSEISYGKRFKKIRYSLQG